MVRDHAVDGTDDDDDGDEDGGDEGGDDQRAAITDRQSHLSGHQKGLSPGCEKRASHVHPWITVAFPLCRRRVGDLITESDRREASTASVTHDGRSRYTRIRTRTTRTTTHTCTQRYTLTIYAYTHEHDTDTRDRKTLTHTHAAYIQRYTRSFGEALYSEATRRFHGCV